jgi:tetratricopeptide (TPR) repeat protein
LGTRNANLGTRNANIGTRAGVAGGANRAGVNAAGTRNQVNVGNHTVNLANNNYRPSYAGHAGLYHGYWGGYGGYGGYGGFGRGFGYGPFGYGGFGYGGFGGGFGSGLGYGLGMGLGYGLLGGMFSPMGWGMGGWGMGSMGYGSGYLGYNNPYCGGGGGGCGGFGGGGYGGGYSYAQPLPVNYNSASPSGTATSADDDMLNAAIAAFKQGDYDSALDITNKAVAQYPTDAVLHEFRATVLFAKGDYQQSAAVLHSLLAVGPGWDWTTMSKLYPDISVYTSQLRALEASVRNRPDDPAGHFVLAYEYMTAGHTDAAAGQLAKVTQLVSSDKVAADLLRMLRPPANAVPSGSTGPGPVPNPPRESATTPGAAANPNQPAVPSGPPVDPQILLGSWNASRENGAKFHLTLGKDETFHWTFTAPGQAPKELNGKYTVDHNVLALEQTGGGALMGQVTPHGDNQFNFKMLGAPPEDKGLDFSH